ncbi:RrF2 family transcriptional regulator [Exiguobacterium flavidum]|uniref:RrF2 family transcriptional regulator n=1 Tax=Exiguobacterium flavidum TaxID=2184695 RepID=UPI000DF73144|nr:Rrf2 family transcriptional regulator [Exiguobacterium flavidum]
MRITQYTDYGLRVLIYLGLSEGLTPMPVIASHYQISANHLMKVTQELTRLGYVKSTRGRYGGLELACAPSDINIGKVVEQMEPDFNLVECFSEDGFCAIEPSCMLKHILAKSLRLFLDELGKYTLEDLIKNRKQLSLLLHS